MFNLFPIHSSVTKGGYILSEKKKKNHSDTNLFQIQMALFYVYRFVYIYIYIYLYFIYTIVTTITQLLDYHLLFSLSSNDMTLRPRHSTRSLTYKRVKGKKTKTKPKPIEHEWVFHLSNAQRTHTAMYRCRGSVRWEGTDKRRFSSRSIYFILFFVQFFFFLKVGTDEDERTAWGSGGGRGRVWWTAGVQLQDSVA